MQIFIVFPHVKKTCQKYLQAEVPVGGTVQEVLPFPAVLAFCYRWKENFKLYHQLRRKFRQISTAQKKF